MCDATAGKGPQNPQDPKVQLEKQLAAAGMAPLGPEAEARLLLYLELLLHWNARINLTSVRGPQEMIERHFVECIFAARHLPSGISTLLDFGSGAGFPGIPIALCRPEIHVTLAESQGKKAAFLAEALRRLAITGEVHGQRVESMPPGRAFDAVVLRAVDRMADAIAVALPRAKRFMALLTGEEGAKYRQLAPEFSWDEPIPLPPARRAFLMIGRRAE